MQSSSSGSWKHVVGGGSFDDAGLWNTGNGWAAHGIVRVLATMQASPWSESFADEKTDLADWATEILTSAFSHLKVRRSRISRASALLTLARLSQSDSLLPNYYDAASSSYFSDASGSALLAAAAYRLAQVSGTSSEYVVETASTIRSAVNGKINQSTGWVSPVVVRCTFREASSRAEG